MRVRTKKALKTICIGFISLILLISLLIGGLFALGRRDTNLVQLFIQEVINNPSYDLLCKNLSAREKEDILSMVGIFKGKQYKIESISRFRPYQSVVVEFDKKAIVDFTLTRKDGEPFPWISLRAHSLVIEEVRILFTFNEEEGKWIRTIDKKREGIEIEKE